MQSITRRHFSWLVAGLSAKAFAAPSLAWPSAAQELSSQVPAGPAPRHPLTGRSEDPFAALMAYDPQADADAPFFRSITARAQRIPAWAATQAHPTMSAQPQLACLTGCYRSLGPRADDQYRRQRYGVPPEDGVYVSRMMAPLDIVVGWSGTGVIPNPALTDVAHRNGALCLGLIFQPDKRVYDSSATPAREVAAQYARLAAYFGYDGYFVNFESGTPAQHKQVLELIVMMREEAHKLGKTDFYVQFYDGSSEMDQLLPKLGASNGSNANSAMLDQGWSGYNMVHGCCSGRPVTPEHVRQYCEANGLDPLQSAYFGFQLYPGPGYLGVAAPAAIPPNGQGAAFGSLQIYSYEDGFWTMRRAATAKDTQPLPPREAEKAFYELERLFFSGQSGNPALSNQPTAEQDRLCREIAHGTRRYADYSPTADPATEQVTLPITYGVANFTAERSVIGSFPFLTRFNVGAGQSFFLEGEKASARPWFNLGIQDLLPTWQWRMEPIGRALPRDARAYAPLHVRYAGETAFQGGSSLHIHGSLDAGEPVSLYLYKTRLPIQSRGTHLQLVWQGVPDTLDHLALGLLFEDAPHHVLWLPWRDRSVCTTTKAQAGWQRSRFELGKHRSRTLAAIALGFQPQAAAPTAFDLHLGELYAGDETPGVPPGAPSGFTATGSSSQAHPGTVDVRFRWHAREQDLWYDLFVRDPTTQRSSWLGRISGNCFFAEAVPSATATALVFQLVATDRQAMLTPGPAAEFRLSL